MTSTASKWLPASLAPLERSALSLLSLMHSPVRIEEHTDDESYRLRAEAPGLDPAKDVTVTYHGGALRLQIRRADVRKEKSYTEFNYGSYDRTVPVRTMIDEESIQATYQDGILEIKAKLAGPDEPHRDIEVTLGTNPRPSRAAKP